MPGNRSGAERKGPFCAEKPVAGFGNLHDERRGAVSACKFLIERSDELIKFSVVGEGIVCLLYKSAAADERSSVDLGGPRIFKKKKRSV